jgi:hypothetical protein
MRAKKRLPADAVPSADEPRFGNIEFLIDGEGDVTIGSMGPIRCVATAANADQSLAMLVRRDGGTLMQLLARLDAAIAKGLEDGIGIDEVNNGPSDAV